MTAIDRLAGSVTAEVLPVDGRPLQQALKALKIARRILAGSAPDLAGPHVQLAIDLIEPLGRQQAACRLLPINGGKLDAKASCSSVMATGIAS